MFIPTAALLASSDKSAFPNATGYSYVSPNGSDARDGKTARDAKLTIQAAYDALPDYGGVGTPRGGGSVIADFGRYDLLGGVQMQKTKPVDFQSLTGSRASRGTTETQYANVKQVVLYSSTLTGADTALITIKDPTGTNINGYGFTFRGLFFDLTGDVQYGVDAENVNDVHVIDNGFHTRTVSPAREQFLCRARAMTAHGDDASWWRVERNMGEVVGICDMGGGTGSNCNQHLVGGNLIDGLGSLMTGVRIEGGTRCVTRDNNIEGNGVYAEHYIECFQCRSRDNAGESSSMAYWLWDDNCGDCVWEPIGAIIPGSQILVGFATPNPQVTAWRQYAQDGGAGGYKQYAAPGIRKYAGSPEGNVLGIRGDLCCDVTGGFLYVKRGTDGTNTGWKLVTQAA